MCKHLTVIFLTVLIAACSSTSKDFSAEVREGMDKDEVLKIAGSPKRTFRSNSQDHWIYVFFKKEDEYSRQVSFEDGKVVKVSRPSQKHNWGQELENLKKD